MKRLAFIVFVVLLACGAGAGMVGERRTFKTPEEAVWAAKAFVDGYLTRSGVKRNEIGAFVVRDANGDFVLTPMVEGLPDQVAGMGDYLRKDDTVLFQFHSHPNTDIAGASNQDYYAAKKLGVPSIVYDERSSKMLMLAPTDYGTWLYWQIQKRGGQTIARQMESWEFSETDGQRIRTLDYLETGRQGGANDREGHRLAMPFSMMDSIVPDAEGRFSSDPERIALYKEGKASPPGLGNRPLGAFVEGYDGYRWVVESTVPEHLVYKSTPGQESDSSSENRQQFRNIREDHKEHRQEDRKGRQGRKEKLQERKEKRQERKEQRKERREERKERLEERRERRDERKNHGESRDDTRSSQDTPEDRKDGFSAMGLPASTLPSAGLQPCPDCGDVDFEDLDKCIDVLYQVKTHHWSDPEYERCSREVEGYDEFVGAMAVGIGEDECEKIRRKLEGGAAGARKKQCLEALECRHEKLRDLGGPYYQYQ